MKVFDPKKHDFRPEDKVKPTDKAAREAKRETEELDEALKETFPASDPPAITAPKETESPAEPAKPKKRK